MSCIYVLSCENNTFYIGRTTNVVKRFNAHRLGLGSMWTQANKPIAILELIDDGPFVELVTTLQYMYKYGLECVRGGPWCTLVLTTADIDTIHKLLASEGFQRSEQPVLVYPEEDTDTASNTGTTNGNAGKKWDSDQISKLVMHITDAMPVAEIAKRLQRTEGAIRARVANTCS
jgi:hypothetical protein